MIKRWKPWEHSTGPRTARGKAKVAGNAYRGGHRQKHRELMKQVREVLKDQHDLLTDFEP